jgi:hypothetical protein
MDTPKPFVTLEQLASNLRLPAAWLRREADSGRIPVIRAGRRRMFDEAAVRTALLARQGTEGRRNA